jgi:hypothetical protein
MNGVNSAELLSVRIAVHPFLVRLVVLRALGENL